MRIIPARDKREDGHARLSLRTEALPVEQFAFERGKEALAERIVEALLYNAILTMLVSRTLQELLQQADQDPDPAEIHFPRLRTAAVLCAWADILLRAVLKQAGCPEPEYNLTELIRKEAADPNRSRRLLLQRIQAI